jgi:hypothetical protein
MPRSSAIMSKFATAASFVTMRSRILGATDAATASMAWSC